MFDEKTRQILLKILDYMDSRETIISQPRYDEFMRACEAITQCSTDFEGVGIEITHNDPYPGNSIMDLQGELLVFDNPALLAEILLRADCVSITPLIDDRVSLSIEYRNTSIPVERVVENDEEIYL